MTDQDTLRPRSGGTASLEVLTVTYAPDLPLFEDLQASVQRFTENSVVHTVVVDDGDVDMFKRFEGPRCRILKVSDVLPSSFVKVPTKKFLMNLRRPWPPVRGWVFQQLIKIAMVARSRADLVLLMDSDVALTRTVDADTFQEGGKPIFFRNVDAVHAGMERHVLWHRGARRMLGLDDRVAPPLNDYVDSFNVWVPDLVRQMCDRIAATCRTTWQTAFAANLHVSEFILYGVFVDEILQDSAPLIAVDRMRCHNYWDEVPLDRDEALAFVDRADPTDIALMISAKSRTALDVRREALARAQIAPR